MEDGEENFYPWVVWLGLETLGKGEGSLKCSMWIGCSLLLLFKPKNVPVPWLAFLKSASKTFYDGQCDLKPPRFDLK